VAAGIGQGAALVEIQKTLTLDAYKSFERWDTTREAHIEAVYATMRGNSSQINGRVEAGLQTRL
jgi:hypothetical protein